MSVDLPTPDNPRNATVRRGFTRAASASSPSRPARSRVGRGMARRHRGDLRHARRHVVARVRLVEDDDGRGAAVAGEQDVASRRRRLKSASRPETRNTVSMLAATTCSSVRLPATFRRKALRRGSTTQMA